jgi:aminopeptidase-like protein
MNVSTKETMDQSDFQGAFDPEKTGNDMHRLITELYPICRSITGNGVRETLSVLRRHIPLEIVEVPTGTKVFDWTVPQEWNIRDAYVKNANGEKIIDFKKSNLHVLNYSSPVNKRVSLAELKEHLYTISEHPDWIPYRTSYYRENWGFCMSHNQLLSLRDEEYEVCVDSTLTDGSLTYGELYIPGKRSEEILLSSHVCHPSLCNDNLSGVALSTFVSKHLSGLSLKYSYRFLFIPGTIGSITWLSLNEANVSKIKHGLVLACLGDNGKFTYKKSRRGTAEIDRSVIHVLKSLGGAYDIQEFIPFGYDERQYCSPGFNLPVGCFMRTPHGRYAEYHTSADNLDFVRPEPLGGSFSSIMSVLYLLENNITYLNQNPKCEPQLGKRGLYQMIGGQQDSRTKELAMLWVLNLSDGANSLLDIAERASLSFDIVKDAADILFGHGLLKECVERDDECV